MKEKQAAMEFTHTYKVEKMGVIMSSNMPHIIFLFSSFLNDKLKASLLDADPVFRKNDGLTRVGCPFCKKGVLKIKTVKPEYSGGLARMPSTLKHTGNHYEYICSNQECDGMFVGSHTWIHID